MKLHLPHKLLAALMSTVAVHGTLAADTLPVLNLYILTGQSNSLGVYYSDRLTDAEIAAYSSDILFWNGNTNSGGSYLNGSAEPLWKVMAEGTYSGNGSMGPEYGFAYMMEKKGWNTSGNNEMAVIKVSCDGGSNERWTANNDFYKGMRSHVVEAIDGIDASRYSRINIAGLLYLQGETVDTGHSEQYKEAADRYAAFLTQLKSDLKEAGYSAAIVDKLVIDDTNKILTETVAGEPATWGDSTKTAQSSKGANELMTLSGTRSDMGWVFTRDLDKTKGDMHGVHYTQKAQLTIGARYAYAMALTHNATNPADQWEIGAVRNDRYDGCGEYPAVESTAYGATTGQHYSLNDAAAWWNGNAPGANDVITWDVSSANQRNGETISADLSVKGIFIEDPYSDTIVINNVEGGDHTLGTGTSGITLQGSNLTVNTNFATTADQTWTVAEGKSLELNGTLGGDHAVSIDGAGASVSIMGLSAADAHTWTVGDNVGLTLGAAGGGTTISTLTLGGGDVVDLGGKTVQNLTITNLQAAQGGTFLFNIAGADSYDRLTLGGASSLGGDIVFNIAVGGGVRQGGTFTLVDGWTWGDAFTSNITGLGSGATGTLALQGGSLVFTLAGAADASYAKPWATGTASTATATAGLYSVCATEDNVKVTSGPDSGDVYIFTAASNINTTGAKYAELDSSVHANWVGAVGSTRAGDGRNVTGDMYMRVSGSGTQSYTAYGVVNATHNGNAYLELDAANATFSAVSGLFQSNVAGSLTMVLKNGTFTGTVVGGATHPTATQRVSQGVYLEMDGGTYSGQVYGGSTGTGTITGGTHMVIKGGSFSGEVYGGNSNNGAVTNDGVEMIITGGNFNKFVYGGNSIGGTINGGVSIIVAGNANFSGLCLIGGNHTGGTIKGNVDMLLESGTFSYVYGGNNGGDTVTEASRAV